jgi:hypothetical protein
MGGAAGGFRSELTTIPPGMSTSCVGWRGLDSREIGCRWQRLQIQLSSSSADFQVRSRPRAEHTSLPRGCGTESRGGHRADGVGSLPQAHVSTKVMVPGAQITDAAIRIGRERAVPPCWRTHVLVPLAGASGFHYSNWQPDWSAQA